MTQTQIAPWLADSRWPTVPIRFLARLGTGHTPSRNVPDYWENCSIPWITLADVWQLRDGSTDVITDTKEKISELGLANSAAVKHPAGTVILSRTASVGFSAIMGADMATSQDFATWTCGPGLHNRYLLHALRAMANDLKRVAAGSTHKTIYMPDIEQLRIPTPPIDEQRRIADFLHAETARIDSLFTNRVRQRSVLDERSYAEVSEVLLPGTPSDARGHWRWPWLPHALPRHSPLVRIGYVCRLQNGLTVDGNRDVSGDVVTRPYLRVANVQAGYVDLGTVTNVTVPRETARRCALRTGDVLMTEGGDLDKLGRGTVWRGELPDCLHQNHVFALRPEVDRLDGDYLALMTRTVHGRNYFESTGSKTTNLASTNSSKILSFPIPLPSVSRQRELVRTARMRLEVIGRVRETIDRQLALLAERRQALIIAAVTGQIDISTAGGRGIED